MSEPSPVTARVGGDEGTNSAGAALAPPDPHACPATDDGIHRTEWDRDERGRYVECVACGEVRR